MNTPIKKTTLEFKTLSREGAVIVTQAARLPDAAREAIARSLELGKKSVQRAERGAAVEKTD